MKMIPWENLHRALGLGVALAVVVFLIRHVNLIGDGEFWSFLFRLIHIWS